MPRILRPFQSEAITLLQRPEIHLVLTAPTGSGKGVILEEIARDPHERILLITPLIALGRQQSRRFTDARIPHHSSVGLGGASDPGPGPKDRVWISSPEAALAPKRSASIRKWRPTLVAIDEAHCLEEWGESFRPAYRELLPWVRALGISRTFWMSATFPHSLARTLRTQLPGAWESRGNFALPENLEVRIRRVSFPERLEIVRSSVLEKSAPGILFVGTRKNSENYAQLLNQAGIALLPYHAGMSDEERRAIEAQLERGKEARSPSISATSAFGMGMDFPQLEWALIAQTPLSLLALMQALGRVGRAGRNGSAEIYWAEEDFRIAGYLVSKVSNRESAEARLGELRKFLEGSAEIRREILRAAFT